MKVFILALDGLEYDLVVKWRLKNLLQRTYGKLRVGEEYWTWTSGFGRPYSPLVWTSFITGAKPRAHGITGFWTYRSKPIEWIRKLPLIAKFRGKRAFLSRFGVKPQLQQKRDLKVRTMFDVIQPSFAIDVLGYNPEMEIRAKQFRCRNVEDYMKTARTGFLELRKKMFDLLEEPWKLFMFYVHYTDAAGHCWPFGRLKLVYQLMDLLTTEIKDRLEEDTIFLIISDHGIETTDRLIGQSKDLKGAPKHCHSMHAFYSLSFETSWKPKDITDFYPKILQWSNMKQH